MDQPAADCPRRKYEDQIMLPTLKLFGLRLLNTSRNNAAQLLLESPGKTTVAFLNAHCVNIAAQDRAYKRALRAADHILPDGIGIRLAAKLSGQRLEDNLNGTDLCLPLCQEAARRGKSLFLLGAAPGVAEEAARNLTLKVPGLRIVGTRDGFFDDSHSDDVIAEINQTNADIVMVAMGVPLQDVWLHRHRRSLNAQLALGVGALFDFKAGRVQRAPKLVRQANLEWLWRLGAEPRRMFNRYVIGNPLFVGRAMVHAARNRPQTRSAMPGSKRLLDEGVALLALVLLSPVFLATAIAVKATSRGPVFFLQERVGFRGQRFQMIKFRSMYLDAEERRAELLKDSDRDAICFKMRADPRITSVGRFIRRFSIDELPQLINVLRGDMSLVGPRPALPSEVAQYPTPAMRRLHAVPGITGVWQVSGRAEIGFERMVAMDVAYMRSKSLVLDLILLALTARAVFSGRGAY
jgi:exopolysaccharide biosynthesis WecB/TagA/CpsF family protein